MKVFFTESAELDFEAIGDWIAKDNPERATTFVRELCDNCVAIGGRPLAHPFVERRRNDGMKRKVHGSHLIFYRVEPRYRGNPARSPWRP